MKESHICFNLYTFPILFFLFQIKFILSIVLDELIPLADHPHKYSHFSFTSEGDMIIDTHPFPFNNERKFYGLKKNGKYFFKSSNDLETPYYNLTISDMIRIEGESIFIKFKNDDAITGYREYLMGISKNDPPINANVEIYDFNDEATTIFKKTNDFFGDISSEIFSIIEYPIEIDSHFYYVFSYIKNNNFFVIMKAYFTLSSSQFHENSNTILTLPSSNKTIVSCFFTEQLKYICFYQNDNKKYTIIVFAQLFINDNHESTKIYEEENAISNSFFKGIHLKKEIGVFMYYKNDNYPTMILKECDSNNNIIDYSSFGEIQINKKNFINEVLLNNLMKISHNKICFISPKEDRKTLFLIDIM